MGPPLFPEAQQQSHERVVLAASSSAISRQEPSNTRKAGLAELVDAQIREVQRASEAIYHPPSPLSPETRSFAEGTILERLIKRTISYAQTRPNGEAKVLLLDEGLERCSRPASSERDTTALIPERTKAVIDYYISFALEDDISQHMSKAQKGARPEVLEWAVVGIPKGFEGQMEKRVRELLNKFSAKNVGAICAELISLIRKEAQEAPTDAPTDACSQNLLSTVKIVFDELLDKAAMEHSFSELYAQLTLDILGYQDDEPVSFGDCLKRFLKGFFSDLVATQSAAEFRRYSIDRKAACDAAGLRTMHFHIDNNVGRVMARFFTQYIVYGNIYREVDTSQPRSPYFLDQPSDTAASRAFKRNNREHHLKGVVRYLSCLFSECSSRYQTTRKWQYSIVHARIYIVVIKYLISRQIKDMLASYAEAGGSPPLPPAPPANVVAASGLTFDDISGKTRRFLEALSPYRVVLAKEFHAYWRQDYVDMIVGILQTGGFVVDTTLAPSDPEFIEYEFFLAVLTLIASSDAVDMRLRFLVRELLADRQCGWTKARSASQVALKGIERGPRQDLPKKLAEDVMELGLTFVAGVSLGYPTSVIQTSPALIHDSPADWADTVALIVTRLVSETQGVALSRINTELIRFLDKAGPIAADVYTKAVTALVQTYVDAHHARNAALCNRIVEFVFPVLQKKRCLFVSALRAVTNGPAHTYLLIDILRRIALAAALAVLADEDLDSLDHAKVERALHAKFLSHVPAPSFDVRTDFEGPVFVDDLCPFVRTSLKADGYGYFGDEDAFTSPESFLLTPMEDYAMTTMALVIYTKCSTAEEFRSRNALLSKYLDTACLRCGSQNPMAFILEHFLGFKCMYAFAVRGNPGEYVSHAKQAIVRFRCCPVLLAAFLEEVLKNNANDSRLREMVSSWPLPTVSRLIISETIKALGKYAIPDDQREKYLLRMFKAFTQKGVVSSARMKSWIEQDASRRFGSTVVDMPSVLSFAKTL